MQEGLRHYFTGKPCKNGHLEKRLVNCGTCMACSREKSLRYHYAHPQKAAEKARSFLGNNPGYVEENRAKINAASKKYRAENTDLCTMRVAKLKLAKRRAVPGWFNEFDELVIQEAHRLCRVRKIATAVNWEIDHIVPISGKNVCGLHVAENVRVITASENRRKSNKYFSEVN